MNETYELKKHHELLYKTIETQYYFLADRLPLRQDSLFKTYLWSASLALALGLSILQKIQAVNLVSLLSAASMLISFTVLVLTLNALRGSSREDLQMPDVAAYMQWTRTDNDCHIAPLMFEQMTGTITHLRAIQSLRGLRLRTMSRLLVLSFGLLGSASLFMAFK